MTDAASREGEGSGRRRMVMLGLGVGAAALLGGGGLAWWQLRDSAVGSAAPDALWGLRFDTPGGAQIAMADLRGRPLLINFWATWCPPCVEELPLLDGFHRQQPANGLKVLGLAIDQPSAVRQFLARAPVTFPIGLAGLGGTELAKSLGNLSGGLPFSVALDAAGQVRQRRMGKLSGTDLQQWGRALRGPDYQLPRPA